MHTASMKNSTGRNFTPSRRGIYTLVGRTRQANNSRQETRGKRIGDSLQSPRRGNRTDTMQKNGWVDIENTFALERQHAFHKAKHENHWSCFTKSSRGS